MKRLPILLALAFVLIINGQENQPNEVFRSPLDIPLILAGTFGELRSNHFHSGIDIKTQQREGLPIYAVAEGTVTRIKVSLWGYGKVMYVAHPNGYTSVYGHLQKFAPDIEAYIKKVQYEKRAYEVEVFPDFGEIKVSDGQLIAYSGNTGGSSGPHLHFEIRSSVSEKPLNPLLYGLEVKDATNPVIEKLFAYPLSNDAVVNKANGRTEIKFSKQKDGTFLAENISATGTIGFGVIGYDRQDLGANQNGLYTVRKTVNGEVYAEYAFDTFSFAETRYINTLIDYGYLAKYGERIQKTFKTPGNKLGIYKTLKNNGMLEVKEDLDYNIELMVNDLHGNSALLTVPVTGKKEALELKIETAQTENFLIAKKPNNYDLGGAKVFFPANTFYEDFYIDLKKGADTVTVHNNTVPVHRNFTLTFDVTEYADADRQKMFIARFDKKMQPNYIETFKRGETFSAKTRDLGTFTLMKDTLAPKIRPKNFKERQWLNNYQYLSLNISDDLSGISSYSATLNGQWILMEYEPKRNTITYNFDDKILDQTQCDLIVIVTDNVGNSTTFTSTFYRK